MNSDYLFSNFVQRSERPFACRARNRTIGQSALKARLNTDYIFPRQAVDLVHRLAYNSNVVAFEMGSSLAPLKNSQLSCGDVTIICETVHEVFSTLAIVLSRFQR